MCSVVGGHFQLMFFTLILEIQMGWCLFQKLIVELNTFKISVLLTH